nr:conjugal transfer protein TraF [Motilimonas eburnea]
MFCSITALAGSNDDDDNLVRGWHWYEEVEEVEALEPTPTPIPMQGKEEIQNSKEIELNVAWLKENLPKLRDKAIESPTDQNLRNFYGAQRLMIDMGTRFASRSSEFFKFNPELSESERRPTSNFALFSYSDEVERGRKSVMDKVEGKAGLWFFFLSDCPYCEKMASVLQILERKFNFEVLPVSLDGRGLVSGEYPDFVYDPNGKMATKLQITAAPTVYLVTKDGMEFYNVTQRLVSAQEMEERVLLVAREASLITHEQFNTASEIKDHLTVDRNDGLLSIDEEKLLNDPAALSELIESRVGNSPSTANPFTLSKEELINEN